MNGLIYGRYAFDTRTVQLGFALRPMMTDATVVGAIAVGRRISGFHGQQNAKYDEKRQNVDGKCGH